MSLWSPWPWAVLGLVCVVGEALTSGFVLLGFALAAFAMAAIVYLAGTSLQALPVAEAWLLVLFALEALGAWIGLSRTFGRRGKAAAEDRDINDF
jgi:membrane protein implicated in regulation of membrane protease activity